MALNSHVSNGNMKATHQPPTLMLLKKYSKDFLPILPLQSRHGGQQGDSFEDRQREAPLEEKEGGRL